MIILQQSHRHKRGLMKVDEWRCKVEVVSTSDVERIHLSARRASQSRDQQSHLLEYIVESTWASYQQYPVSLYPKYKAP